MALGHPKGLFPLFFTEMWERLAFYTMLGILLLYTTDLERGGLGLPSAEGNEIYGLYLAFVYFTPFLGGMIADRFLGYRKAVFLGGILMSTGLFFMSIRGVTPFMSGLLFLILGNGFFKPNISVMVGNLYEPGDPKRDAGFNIFYMGINIGALIATLLAASVRNNLGWLWTFRVAGVGILIGLVVMLSNWKVLEKADRKPERKPGDTGLGSIFIKILLPAFAVGIIGYFLAKAYLPAGFSLRPAVCGFLAGMIPVLGFFVHLGLKAPEKERPGLLSLLPLYVAGGTFFMILHLNGSAMTQWARDYTDRRGAAVPSVFQQEALPLYYINAEEDVLRPHPMSLLPIDSNKIAQMYGQQRMDESAVDSIKQISGITVVEFSLDSRSDNLSAQQKELEPRTTNVYKNGIVSVRETTDAHGSKVVTVEIPDSAKPIRRVAFVRNVDNKQIAVYPVAKTIFDNIYKSYKEKFKKDPQLLKPGEFLQVVNPEVYQSFNPLFVIIFTPLVVAFFQFLVQRKKGVTTARKIFIGLVLTTISLLLMAFAGFLSEGGTAKVGWVWLAGFYAIVTLGELCLSPMGLSLVTKLSPSRLVGLTMGGWFMATSFGNNLSGFFGGIQETMSPTNFFLLLAGLAALASLFIFILLPKLDTAIKKYGA